MATAVLVGCAQGVVFDSPRGKDVRAWWTIVELEDDDNDNDQG